MAYDIRNIAVLDLKKSVSIGVKIPFSQENVFTRVFTTKEQLKYNLINFLLTDKRERIFAAPFGAGLRRRIFEQINENTAEEIETSLVTQIENYFPTLRITRLVVSSGTDENTLRIELSYSITNTNESDAILVDIQN